MTAQPDRRKTPLDARERTRLRDMLRVRENAVSELSVRTIARDIGCSPRTVTRELARLRAAKGN